MILPLVSVVVPAHNCERFIAESVESILAQSYPNLELIVVDDGSTDGTFEALTKHSDRIVYHRQSNGGLAAARNTGMRMATGEFIAWMDADDISEPDRILAQAAYLASRSEVAAVGSNFAAFYDGEDVFDVAHAAAYYSELKDHRLDKLFSEVEDFDGSLVEWVSEPFPVPYRIYRGDVWRRLIFGNFMHPPTMMMRRDARERSGWLREGIRKAEDWEYITRLARYGPLAFIDAPLLRYRCHPEQMSAPGSAVGPLSYIRVLESTLEVHADEVTDIAKELKSRLAEFHENAAYTLAERDRWEATKHLAHSFRLDQPRMKHGVLAARILFSRRGLSLLRRLRDKGETESVRSRVRRH